jgi:acetyl-CoA carboxylase beta subunit
MSNTKHNYRIKCEKCGKFVYREEMINNYGRQTCQKCLREQTITKSYALYIPTFILKMAGIKPNDKVTITNEEGEITIKKKKER